MMTSGVTYQPELLSDETFTLAECPNWDAANNRLYWTDILNCKLHAQDIETGARKSWAFDSELGCFGLTDQGRIIVALRKDIILLDPATDERTPLCRIKVEEKATGFKISNGIAWSADGSKMYHSDSRGPWVNCWDFDVATGNISNCTRYLDLDDTLGRPDGGAVDLEGCYWSAGVSAGNLNRFAPDGTLLKSIPMPMPNPTMPCFGGPDMKTLYVTSHQENYSPEKRAEFPHAGKLVKLRVEVPGVPVHKFRENG
jgi:sugar lactone lactonase YvrE